MAIPKNQIDRIRYFAGLLTSVEAVVTTPYLNYLKGRKLGPFPTDTVDYRTVATKKQAAQLLGYRKIEGQTLRQVGFDEFRLTPGTIVQSEIITAMDANLMRADNILYVNNKQLDAEESTYRDKAYNIKTAIELRKNIMTAQLINEGEYKSADGRKVAFPIRPIDTLNYTVHGKFITEYRKQLREFIKANGKRPDAVLVGDKIVDELLQDPLFIDQVYKLGLANFDQDNKNVIIARVLGTQLEEMSPAFDPDLEVDSVKPNMLTLLNTSRLHEAYAGLPILVGNSPKLVSSEYIAYEDLDSKNQIVEFIGKSAFSPVLSDANAVWRIQVDLPTSSPQSLRSFPEQQGEELSKLVADEVKKVLSKEKTEETPGVNTEKGKGKK